jgi:acyl-CoA thioester hydrolase
MVQSPNIATPGFAFCCTLVPGPETIDYNGHVNIGHYGLLFEDAARAFLPRYDLSRQYRERTNRALFVVEMHMGFWAEIREGETVDVHFRLVDTKANALHALYLMISRKCGEPAAWQEVLYLHIDLATRKVVPMDPHTQDALADLITQQVQPLFSIPVGRRIALRR